MNRGFTLIELIIVIAIGTLIVSVGAFSLIGARNGQNIQTETQELVAVLESAREKSIGQDTGGGLISSRWGVCFDTAADPDMYYLYQVNEGLRVSMPKTDCTPGDIIDTHTLKAGVSLTLSAPSDSSIIFSKAAGRPETPTSITIGGSDPAMDKSVTVSAQGKVDWQ